MHVSSTSITKYPVANSQNLRLAEDYLAKVDPIIGRLINVYGPCQLKPHDDYYGALVGSIISQQLSVKAAESITNKFMALFGGLLPSPDQILTKSHEELRSAGLSGPKVGYIADLAAKINDGSIELNQISKLSNDQITSELTTVKGIGVWTSHMFLIFCVGRLDVLPYGDLGIRKSLQKLYNLPSLPSESEVTDICVTHKWQAYASVVSWYAWQSLDNAN